MFKTLSNTANLKVCFTLPSDDVI